MPAADNASISATVMAWAGAWQQQIPTAIFAHWDLADPHSWYLLANSIEPVIGQAVVGAIQRRCREAKSIIYQPNAIHARTLSPDLGLAFFELQWSEQILQRAHDKVEHRGGNVRVTMLMRRIDGTWKIFHYAEAPLAPLLELQAFYEAIAADGFEKMPGREFARASQL